MLNLFCNFVYLHARVVARQCRRQFCTSQSTTGGARSAAPPVSVPALHPRGVGGALQWLPPTKTTAAAASGPGAAATTFRHVPIPRSAGNCADHTTVPLSAPVHEVATSEMP